MSSRYIYISIHLSSVFFSLFHYAATPNHTNHPNHPRLAQTRRLPTQTKTANRTVETSWTRLRFYLTGHSLGGGLAKLVALEVGKKSVPASVADATAVWGGWWVDDFNRAFFFWGGFGSGMTFQRKNKGDPKKLKGFLFSMFFFVVWPPIEGIKLGHALKCISWGCFFLVIWWWVDLIFGGLFLDESRCCPWVQNHMEKTTLWWVYSSSSFQFVIIHDCTIYTPHPYKPVYSDCCP